MEKGEKGDRRIAIKRPPWSLPNHFPKQSSRTIPGGLACLITLNRLGIAHRHLGRRRGIITPVRITGPIGGIRYVAMGKHDLVCDCRLALALYRAAPLLVLHNVEEVHFSSAYSYRRRAGGKLSRHAMGLAIDVHRLKVRDEVLHVERDFIQGLEDGCSQSSPVLNQISCFFERQGIFDRVLTPDYDWAHRNHFHLAILSLHRRRFVHRETPLPPEVD